MAHEEGGLEAPRKKKKTEDEIDVAPLIDCTFILLMYFIVIQAMSPRMDANVPDASHGIAMKKETASMVTIKLSKDTMRPSIMLGDSTNESPVAAVTAYVQDGLRMQKDSVIIMADRNVPHGVVQQVLKAAGKVEGVKLGIAVKDKKVK